MYADNCPHDFYILFFHYKMPLHEQDNHFLHCYYIIHIMWIHSVDVEDVVDFYIVITLSSLCGYILWILKNEKTKQKPELSGVLSNLLI